MSTAEGQARDPLGTGVAEQVRSGVLPDDLSDEIAALGRADHHARGACIEGLRLVQERFGWVSDEHLKEIARILGMGVADLDGVATFFNLIFRRPVGRNVIMLCDSVSCWIMGQEGVRDHLCRRLKIRLGETTPDDEVTLLPIVCLGHCDHGPAMLVGQELHGDLTPEKVDEILDALPGRSTGRPTDGR